MRSLVDMFNDTRFNALQRGILDRVTEECMSEHGQGKKAARACIIQVLANYSAGGISWGRSLRSAVLDKVGSFLEEHNAQFYDERVVANLLSVLIAMYCSPTYINRHRWFDSEIAVEEGLGDIPSGCIEEMAYLFGAVFALNLGETVLLDGLVERGDVAKYVKSVDIGGQDDGFLYS